MKCLSLMQPYAQLVSSGRKRIELWSWNTRYRGWFLVHASKKLDSEAADRLGIGEALARGAVIGKARIYGVKRYNNREELAGDYALHMAQNYKIPAYGFLLDGAELFEKPREMNGKLGFFDIDA